MINALSFFKREGFLVNLLTEASPALSPASSLLVIMAGWKKSDHPAFAALPRLHPFS